MTTMRFGKWLWHLLSGCADPEQTKPAEQSNRTTKEEAEKVAAEKAEADKAEADKADAERAAKEAGKSEQDGPARPTGVATSPALTKITVVWTPIAGISKNRVLYANDATVAANAAFVEVDAATYVHEGLDPGATWAYAVAAVDSSGKLGPYSVTVSTKTTLVLAAVTGLTATPGNAEVDLAWSSVAEAAGYRVFAAAGATLTATELATPVKETTTPSAKITGMTNGVTVGYAVQAFFKAAESPVTALVTATPLAPGMAPANVQVTALYKAVRVSFDAVPGATEYRAHYGTGAVGVDSPHVAGATTTLVIPNQTPGQALNVRLEAIHFGHTRPLSNEVTATPLAKTTAPLNVAKSLSGNNLTVTFDSVYGATGYRAHYASGGSVAVSDAFVAGSASPIVISLLAGSYTISVTSLCPDGESALGANLSQTVGGGGTPLCDALNITKLDLANIPAAAGGFVATSRLYGRDATAMLATHLTTYDHSLALKARNVFVAKATGDILAIRAVGAADLNGTAMRPLVFDDLMLSGVANLAIVVEKTDGSMVKNDLAVAYMTTFSAKPVVDLSPLSLDAGFSKAFMPVARFTPTGLTADTNVTYPNTYNLGNTRNLQTAQTTTTWSVTGISTATVTDVMGNIVDMSGSSLIEYHTFVCYFEDSNINYRTMYRVV